MRWAWANASGKPYEPDFIASLVINGTPEFCHALNNVFSGQGISLSMASVFCHNKPMVKFSAGTCELGDVLFVHRHISMSGERTHQALLLQAKMCRRHMTTINSRGDLVQLLLYADWPAYEYVRTSTLNGVKRDITPKTAHGGAQYLLVDSRGPGDPDSGILGIPGTHTMAVWPAERILFSCETLASVLVNFLLGLTGRRFLDLNLHDASEWSDMIWDLLKYAAGNTFSRGRVNMRGQGRAAGDVFFWSSDIDNIDDGYRGSAVGQQLLGSGAGSDIPLEELPTDDEGTGVSIVVIDTVERDS